ncbi:hypothetical protein EP10_002628 [Geobacillus icigianus]|uniref:PTS EIIB type-1 domain-containing protein n=1 Tax=Geobacillus icigianus TaxID=1430331 RepID=A0ABU6BK47_9BACL|nr:hypothetical protein [Geobacillus icigianus]
MTREQQIAISILQYVGGKENIIRIAHCMTRVRVSLRDPGKANMDALKVAASPPGAASGRPHHDR